MYVETKLEYFHVTKQMLLKLVGLIMEMVGRKGGRKGQRE